MQNEYDMLMAECNESFMEKLKQIRRIAAVFFEVLNTFMETNVNILSIVNCLKAGGDGK